MEAVQQLRAATAADHDAVDAAFGAFALDDRAGYARFLAALGEDMPEALPFAMGPDAAERFGAAYVIEGSRLGGGMLSKRIATGWPSAYLSATFLPGEWRDFLTKLDASAGGDADWIARAVASAKATFALYRQAAAA